MLRVKRSSLGRELANSHEFEIKASQLVAQSLPAGRRARSLVIPANEVIIHNSLFHLRHVNSALPGIYNFATGFNKYRIR
jgi:hypothetical protein